MLDLRNLDYDLDLSGFNTQEIDELLLAGSEDHHEDDAPAPPEIPTSRAGDLWLCGPHRILCADATSAEAVTQLLNGRNPRLMITDPPYGIELDSEWRDRAGQTIETILTLSAQEVAGARTPGKATGDIRWHGSQSGRVMLADRQVKVKRPRLRHKREGVVPVPAYEALQDNGATAQRMMGALLRGVSTRQYEEVLPEMASTAGVSKSSISRQAIEGSAEQLRQLRERRWDKAELLVIYIDGQRFGAHHVISAVGIDREGGNTF